jgi:hypothetical protein
VAIAKARDAANKGERNSSLQSADRFTANTE